MHLLSFVNGTDLGSCLIYPYTCTRMHDNHNTTELYI